MSLSRVKNWVSEVLTASDLNAEFNNILNFLNASTVTLTGLTAGTLASTGLLDLSASGAGQIKFPAVQNASADANTLDDYEEGTWTPSIGGTATYTVQVGTYTKIGRLVSILCRLTINSLGSGATGVVTGVPFSSATRSSLTVSYFTNSATAVTYMGAYINGTSISMTALTAAAASVTDGANVFQNGAVVEFFGSYQV